MIAAIIRASVRAKGLVVIVALILTVIGIGAVRTTPVDALPDLSDPVVHLVGAHDPQLTALELLDQDRCPRHEATPL